MRVGQGIDLDRKALGRVGETRAGDAMHRAESRDHIPAFEIVVHRRRHEIEELGRHPRILDVQTKGGSRPLDRKRDGHASPADGDDEAGPGGRERLVGLDRTKEALGRHVDLQPRRQKPHGAFDTHALQAEGKAHGLGHGDALRLHADGAVGYDPGFLAPGLAAGSNQSLGTLRRGVRSWWLGGCLPSAAKTSGT